MKNLFTYALLLAPSTAFCYIPSLGQDAALGFVSLAFMIFATLIMAWIIRLIFSIPTIVKELKLRNDLHLLEARGRINSEELEELEKKHRG